MIGPFALMLMLLMGFLLGVAATLILDIGCGNIREVVNLIADRWAKPKKEKG